MVELLACIPAISTFIAKGWRGPRTALEGTVLGLTMGPTAYLTAYSSHGIMRYFSTANMLLLPTCNVYYVTAANRRGRPYSYQGLPNFLVRAKTTPASADLASTVTAIATVCRSQPSTAAEMPQPCHGSSTYSQIVKYSAGQANEYQDVESCIMRECGI